MHACGKNPAQHFPIVAGATEGREHAWVMMIVLSHFSALDAFRMCGSRDALAPLPRDGARPPARVPRKPALLALIDQSPLLSRLERPLHLLVSTDAGRNRNALVRAHLQRDPLPSGSLLSLCDEVACVSPEHLVVQMAPLLTQLELTCLIDELAGLYAISPAEPEGMVQRERPLMTTESLRAHLRELGPRPGARQARRALEDARELSGSPRESKLSLRLLLPPARGGYHLNVLSMNEPLVVERICSRMGDGVRKPDLLVGPAPSSRGRELDELVAVEYHGRHHDKPSQLVEDANRTNELKAIGVSEYIVRREHYRSLDYMDGLAQRIRAELGLPRIALSREEGAQRRLNRLELYRELELIDGVVWNGRQREQGRASAAAWDTVPLEAYGLA